MANPREEDQQPRGQDWRVDDPDIRSSQRCALRRLQRLRPAKTGRVPTCDAGEITGTRCFERLELTRRAELHADCGEWHRLAASTRPPLRFHTSTTIPGRLTRIRTAETARQAGAAWGLIHRNPAFELSRPRHWVGRLQYRPDTGRSRLSGRKWRAIAPGWFLSVRNQLDCRGLLTSPGRLHPADEAPGWV